MSQKLEYTKAELERMRSSILAAGNIFEMDAAVSKLGFNRMEAKMAFLSGLFGLHLPNNPTIDGGYEKILKYLRDEYEENA